MFPLKLSISFWGINKWFRFTGFRLFFSQTRNEDDPEDYETRIGVMWWGSPFNDGTKNKEERNAIRRSV